MLGIALGLVLAGDAVLGAVDALKDAVSEPPVDARSRAPVYADVPYADDMWTEHARAWSRHFEPYYHWRRDAFSGTYINVDSNGVRRTVKPEIQPGATKVFMFGGSTLWGTGAPDAETIPSIIQGRLGDRYDVYNFGETAYVSAQELNYLLYQLARGNIPEVVIFYDGANDAYAGAYSPAIPRDPQNLREMESRKDAQGGFTKTVAGLYTGSNYKKLVDFFGWDAAIAARGEQAWDAKVKPDIPKNSQAVADMYEANIKQVNALADAYGFKAYFFWQPYLFSQTRKTTPFEQRVIDRASPVWVESQRAVYEAARKRFTGREDEGIFFLGNVFDDVDEPIYIDWCHVGPNGNAIVAREILERLAGKL